MSQWDWEYSVDYKIGDIIIIMNQFDTLFNKVLLEQKRIRMIIVKDKNGKTVNTYAPNHIGTREQELLAKAQKEADEIGGEVLIKRD